MDNFKEEYVRALEDELIKYINYIDKLQRQLKEIKEILK